ncbi:low molecular weight protein-tyrosine-phosphatase [Moraxella sp.]|uniref:low molecular weight protein-tyrosine-phosphatase n=1 Tax=Moraxella sp. TaxID=479 RepID=UPI0026DBA3DC|nr:low molecular weight protein-tyrosine-phosphatase [Moraxella sp.]MDO4894144.1 low molecular weight protein-tyrosine-phosphatase [Moraxella sp.]
MNPPKSVLFVCLGNICRSPSAESVMRKLSQNQGLGITFDSAGTANYHTNEKPDTRAIKVGKSLGYDLSTLRARQVSKEDFYRFDVILAMDENNLTNLQKLQPTDGTARLELFDPTGQAVADPYYGDESDFVAMFAHIEQVVNARLDAWQ